ncbi:MAG: spore germination protein [Bacteroidales bacterium]|nr:spore germination protein [Clostridium sp.]MCM1203458.1 spore germination protein [Bacteroidales bacterium]
MFSCNGKISEKQMRRMLVLPAFAGCIFVLPYLSARFFGVSVLPGLLVFFGLACIYVTCIYGLGAGYAGRRTGTGQLRAEEEEGFAGVMSRKGVYGKCLLVLQLLRLLVRLAFYLILSIEVLGEAQVPFMQGKENDNAVNLFVLLPLLLVALYGANRGIEKQGRLYEMIFWVLFIPFIIVVLFGLGEVDYSVFVPELKMSPGKIILCGYGLLTFILPVENYLYLRPCLRRSRIIAEDTGEEKLRRKKNKVWVSYGAVLFVIALAAVISLFLLGIYGIRGAAGEEMVTIAIMRYIRLPFGVLERFDVLMVWFFMTGCFVMICSTLYYAGYLLQLLCKRGKRVWLLTAVLVFAFAAVCLLPAYSHSLMLFFGYGLLVDIPLSLLVPLLGLCKVPKAESGESAG